MSPAELQTSAFTEGHLHGSRPVGYRAVVGDRRRGRPPAAAGERFVYAYYGGVDKTAHERGFGEFYDAELRAADRLVGDILDVAARRAPCSSSPPTTGRCRSATTSSIPAPELLDLVAQQSGEGRFRWWHARQGSADDAGQGGTPSATRTSPGS